MALKSDTQSLNLSALQRDYSALPKIAAIKAQANQGIFNSIKQGIDNRKQKIKDADEKSALIKVVEGIKNSPFGQSVFGGDNISAADIVSAMGKGGASEVIESVAMLSKANMATTDFMQQQQKLQNASLEASILRLTNGGATPHAIAQQLNIPIDDVKGFIYKSGENLRRAIPARLAELELLAPNIGAYINKLATIPKGKGQEQGSGLLGRVGKEYEAGLFDINANEKFNVYLRTNIDLLKGMGVPTSTIDAIMRTDLPEETGTGTKYRVQEFKPSPYGL